VGRGAANNQETGSTGVLSALAATLEEGTREITEPAAHQSAAVGKLCSLGFHSGADWNLRSNCVWAGQRIQEIGVLMALGAQQAALLALVITHGAKLILAGHWLGRGSGGHKILAGQLYGITAHDPVTLAGAAALLGFVGLLACYIPARRTAKVDPIVSDG
jgi:hypothetical protein